MWKASSAYKETKAKKNIYLVINFEHSKTINGRHFSNRSSHYRSRRKRRRERPPTWTGAAVLYKTEVSSVLPWPHAWSVCPHHYTQPQIGCPSSWPCASRGMQSLRDWQSAPSLSFPPLETTQQAFLALYCYSRWDFNDPEGQAALHDVWWTL